MAATHHLGGHAAVRRPLTARALPWNGRDVDIWTRIHPIDIDLIGLIVLHWTVVLNVGIGAFIVVVMKGPAYVANAHPLAESEHPGLEPIKTPPTRHP